MPTSNQAVFSPSLSLKIRSPWQFSSTGRDLDDSRFEIGFKLLGCRRAAARFIMTPNFVFCEEGAVQVHSTNGGSVFGSPVPLSVCGGIQHRLNLRGTASASGWEQRCRPMARMCSAALVHCFDIAIHEIASSTAMNVDVYEARANPPSLGIDRFSTLGEASF